jgi:ribosomal protein S8
MLLKYDTAINIFQSVSICNKNQSCVQLVKNKNGLSLSIISTKIGLIPIVKAKKCKIGGSQLIKIN